MKFEENKNDVNGSDDIGNEPDDIGNEPDDIGNESDVVPMVKLKSLTN